MTNIVEHIYDVFMRFSLRANVLIEGLQQHDSCSVELALEMDGGQFSIMGRVVRHDVESDFVQEFYVRIGDAVHRIHEDDEDAVLIEFLERLPLNINCQDLHIHFNLINGGVVSQLLDDTNDYDVYLIDAIKGLVRFISHVQVERTLSAIQI